MSYSTFVKELNDYYVNAKEKGETPPHYEIVWGILRDRWIAAGRFKELVSFTLANWDSGNCDDFIKPLVPRLIETRNLGEFRRLWKGIIRIRTSIFWETKGAQDKSFALKAIDQYIAGLKILGLDAEKLRMKSVRASIEAGLKPKIRQGTDHRKMTEELFWQLIDENRSRAEDQFEFLEFLGVELSKFEAAEIRHFHKLLLEKMEELNTWDIWALAYIVRGGCSDDCFDYFKAWVISKGVENFLAIKGHNHSNLKQIFDEEPQLEGFLYLAEEIFEQNTSQIMKPVRIKRRKIKGVEWQEDKLNERFPELCSVFGYNVGKA